MGTRTCPDGYFPFRPGCPIKPETKPDKIIYFTVRKLYPVTSELSRDGN